MINIKNISKRINDKQLFENLSLICSRNETYVLVGPNGTGKSSLLKCLLGLYQIDSGSITVQGEAVSKNFKTSEKTGIFFDTAKMLPERNVKDSLNFFTSLYGKSLQDITDLISYLHLENELDKKYKVLSSGNKRKVGILISLINNPDLVIWDEPFATLDPEMCEELVQLINKLKKQGKTILLTTNDLFFAKDIFDKVGFFLDSKTIIEKNREEILQQFPGKNLNEIYFIVKKEE